MRRLLGGGAPIALVVSALLAAGCGSGGGAGERAAQDTQRGSNATVASTVKQPREQSPTRGRGNERTMVDKAVAPGASGLTRGSSTSSAGPRCPMMLGGQTVSAPCQLRPMLEEAYRRNPALARFLAAAAGGG